MDHLVLFPCTNIFLVLERGVILKIERMQKTKLVSIVAGLLKLWSEKEELA